MTDRHNYSFFGQTTGMILDSAKKEEPFLFLRFIKKKQDNTWEKPSNGEGKNIKFSLEEMVSILQVLRKNELSWEAYHSFQEIKTKVVVKWKDTNYKELNVIVNSYNKMLNNAQSELLRLLLEHIIEEKIEFATVSTYQNGSLTEQEPLKIPEATQHPEEPTKKEIPITKEKVEIESEIIEESKSIKNVRYELETEKAAMFSRFQDNKILWLPKSAIKNEVIKDKQEVQTLELNYLPKNLEWQEHKKQESK